jgi:nucleoside triphosphate diphosphatase
LIRVTDHPTENPARDQRLITALLEVMAALRTPGTGCPWDLEQTFATIAPYTIEEAYEVADAIDKNNLPALKEELGDLLLQVVYHSRMAEERQAFAFADVVQAITAKMIRRHPHVFGTDAERAAGAAPGFWERIKATEKADEGKSGSAGVLDDVPVALPALTRAVKLQHKAAKVGFDWPSLAPVFAKAKEEIAELEEAIADGRKPDGTASEEVAEEFGDLLFVMANVARHLKIDPEAALRAANGKFVRRFERIEALLAADGRTPSQSTLAEMDRLWDQAKKEER